MKVYKKKKKTSIGKLLFIGADITNITFIYSRRVKIVHESYIIMFFVRFYKLKQDNSVVNTNIIEVIA